MGFLTSLHPRSTSDEGGFSFQNPGTWGGGAGSISASGMPVTTTTAMKYSAFWCGVNLIAGHLSAFPLILYKREANGGKRRYDDHHLYGILHNDANEEMSSLMLRRTMQTHVLTWGNAYAEIARNDLSQVTGLYLITPDRVTPTRNLDGELVYRVRNPSWADAVVPATDMLHVAGLGYDGLQGYSLLTMMRESIGLGLAMEKFGSTFFGQGGHLGGVLMHPTTFAPGAKKVFEDSLKRQHTGVERSFNFLVVEEGMKYERIGIPPNDAQFLESKMFQIEEMARWLNLPPHKLKDLQRSTNNNIEHQGIEYYTDTIFPLVALWESEYNRKLIRSLERKSQLIEHLVDAVLRGDIKSRYDAYTVGRQWGWLSVDDIRERENMNPLPNNEGKQYFVPLNMVPATLPAKPKATIEVTPVPVKEPAQLPPARSAEVIDLEKVIDLLERRLALGEQSLAQVKETVEISRAEAQVMATDFASYRTEEIAEADARVKDRELQLAHVTQLVEELRHTLASTQQQLTVAQQVSVSTAAELQQEAARAEVFAAEQQERTAQIERLTQDMQLALAERDTLRQVVEATRQEALVAANQSATVRAEAEARALTAEQIATAAVAEAERLKADTLEQLRVAREQLAAQTSDLAEHWGRVVDAEAAIRSVEAELVTAKAAVEHSLEERAAAVADATAETTHAREERDRFEARSTQLSTELLALHAAHTAQLTALETQTAAVQDAEARATLAEDRRKSAAQAVDQMIEQANAGLDAQRALQTEVDRLTTDLAAALAAHADSAQRVEELRVRGVEQAREAEALVLEREHRFTELTEHLATLTTERDGLAVGAARFEAEVATQAHTVAELRQLLESQQQTHAALTAELADVRLELTRAHADGQQVAADLQRVAAEKADGLVELATAKATAQGLVVELAAASAGAGQVATELAAARDQVRRAEDDVARLSASNGELEQLAQAREALRLMDREQAEQAQEQAQERLQQATAAVTEATAGRVAAEADREVAQVALEEARAALANGWRSLTDQVATLTAERQAARADEVRLVEHLRVSQEAVATAEVARNAAATAEAGARGELATLTTELARLTGEQVATRAEALELQETLRQSQDATVAAVAARDAAVLDAGLRDDELTRLTTEVARLTTGLQVAHEAAVALKRQHQEAETARDAAAADVERVRAMVATQLASLASAEDAREQAEHKALDAVAQVVLAEARATHATQQAEQATAAHQALVEAMEATVRASSEQAVKVATAERALELVTAHLGVSGRERDDAITALTTEQVEVARLRQELEAARRDKRHNVRAWNTEIIERHRRLYEAAMRRMLSMEMERAQRAQATPEKFRRWLEPFYAHHADIMHTALLPLIDLHLVHVEADDDPFLFTQRLVTQHIETSKRQFVALLEEDPEDFIAALAAVFRRWEADRAQVIPGLLIQREMVYARENS